MRRAIRETKLVPRRIVWMNFSSYQLACLKHIRSVEVREDIVECEQANELIDAHLLQLWQQEQPCCGQQIHQVLVGNVIDVIRIHKLEHHAHDVRRYVLQLDIWTETGVSTAYLS